MSEHPKLRLTMGELIQKLRTGESLGSEEAATVKTLNNAMKRFEELGGREAEPDLSDQMIRHCCEFYLADPDMWDNWPGFVRLLMRRFVARVPKAKRLRTAQEIAWQIDLRILTMGETVGDARRSLAKQEKITEEAAILAHKRYGRRKSLQELWPRWGTNGR